MYKSLKFFAEYVFLKACRVMKLLIVEDNLSIRRILKTVVSPLADEILECESGDEAMTIYRSEKPDFVLMDINLLGETNGIMVTKLIRNFDPNAKIIMVTSLDEKDLRQAAADAGAIGFVLKDDLSALSSILRNY